MEGRGCHEVVLDTATSKALEARKDENGNGKNKSTSKREPG
jgi:hypothetical protein